MKQIRELNITWPITGHLNLNSEIYTKFRIASMKYISFICFPPYVYLDVGTRCAVKFFKVRFRCEISKLPQHIEGILGC